MKVYVDGENFRHGVAGVLVAEGAIASTRDLESFPLRRLLEDTLEDRDLQIAYYASKIKLPRGYEPPAEILARATEIREFSRRWVADLATQRIDYIKAGYLKVKTGAVCPKCGHQQDILQEKGVDVRLAVDLIDDAHKGGGKEAVLLSSDTDLIPAIDRARHNGMHITYACFSGMVNRAMTAAANETVTITPRQLLKVLE